MTRIDQAPARITLDQWDARYERLRSAGMVEPRYGGPLRRHVAAGDLRLLRLRFDNSAAALRLWNFLLSEEDRLFAARRDGRKIVAAMKDLGTVPVMAWSCPDVVAFYPDGAWWVPCIMERSTGLLDVADALGVDESFCPVRAMLGAFEKGTNFPRPDMLICSVGATCDDFSAIAQRVEAMGHPILWWEAPARRRPEAGEQAVRLPTGFDAPACQVAFVRGELERVRRGLEGLTGRTLDEAALAEGIRKANHARRLLEDLRRAVFTAAACPMPALELLIAEMLIIHFCSDRDETPLVLGGLLAEVRRRVAAGCGVLPPEAARIFWVNPVADLRAMNLLEDCGGRLCGTELLFCHALDQIPEDLPPMEALARAALADPMVGPAEDRARRIVADVRQFAAEAVVIARIPGASHCALEGGLIRDIITAETHLPVLEIEVPPLSDPMIPALSTRLEAIVEVCKERRR
jgi:benzoyl-CoA reductase/2-hydroxyglutaryl-CoA dehydratase subunit BcrC/BadD/HgdB